MIVFIVSTALAGALVLRRRAKRRLVAGLVSERPAFTVAPPTRWSTSSKEHTL